jgi:hypothetical protein
MEAGFFSHRKNNFSAYENEFQTAQEKWLFFEKNVLTLMWAVDILPLNQVN